MSDISPFQEIKREGDPDLILTNEKAFDKELKSVLDKYKREQASHKKVMKQMKKDISSVHFAQPKLNNCCYYPIIKLQNNELYDNEKISNSIRTRTII